MKFFYITLLVTFFLLPRAGFSAVPDQLKYQGSLNDNTGVPITGSVNFDFAIFDDLTGGSQLWTESQNGTSVVNGIYSVALGSITPITTSILTGGTVYLEIAVDGETLQPRERLLAVPYVLRAQEADIVGGLSSVFVQQIFQHGNYDGEVPVDSDPREGLIDTDGDGRSNFIDSDNDNDGYSDSVEVSNGTDMNLVTPNVTSFIGPVPGEPDQAITDETNLFTVTGTEFFAGMTVQVGTENPVPQNLTSTSFNITVGVGQVIGQQNIIVTLLNGETDTAGPIDFVAEEKLAFVSSNTLANALNQSAATADAFCTTAAGNAGLSGNYVAWYSDTSSNAKDRLPNFASIRRIDGALVATSLADLTDGSIAGSMSIDEFGASVSGSDIATHTLPSGNLAPDSCTGSNPTNGVIGRSSAVNSNWTQVGTESCSAALRLYCFENVEQ